MLQVPNCCAEHWLTFLFSTGGVLQGFMFPFNLGRLGNGISWWLGIRPYELFFYIFLPPLLCDSAVRIDFFLFKQVMCGLCILTALPVIA